MVKLWWLAGLMLMAGAENLAYRPTPASAPVQTEMTYSFAVSGPQGLTRQLLGSNPALSIQQLHATRQGRLALSAGDHGSSHVEIVFDNAQVEGHTPDKPFQFQ